MEDLLSSAVQHLFSIVVAVWLLYSMERRLDELTVAVREVCTVLRTVFCDADGRPRMTKLPSEAAPR